MPTLAVVGAGPKGIAIAAKARAVAAAGLVPPRPTKACAATLRPRRRAAVPRWVVTELEGTHDDCCAGSRPRSARRAARYGHYGAHHGAQAPHPPPSTHVS